MSPELFELRRSVAFDLAESLARETRIHVRDIVSHDRDPRVVAVRHRLWAILYDSGMSLPTIGKIFGFDHTTILAGVRQHDERTRGAA